MVHVLPIGARHTAQDILAKRLGGLDWGELEMAGTHDEQFGLHMRATGHSSRRPLRADELLESALRRGKRRDFADRSFVRPFEHLLRACNEEADLSSFG